MRTSLLHLSLINGIGPVTVSTILAWHTEGRINAALWYRMSVAEWVSSAGLTSSIAQRIVEGLKDFSILENELRLIEKHGVSWATILDDTYPYYLKHIHVPPPIIYWYGKLPYLANTNAIAIVGSRKADQYGKRVTRQLVKDLVKNDWVIVSGGALGIDSFAHQEAVKEGGKTLVVLGSGLLCPYPTINKGLFDDVVKSGGALISIFPLSAQAVPGNFPARNRVIAGLSRGCVVVQAAEKSGAKITAQYALEQGRDVFAVPGLIDEPLSFGCHMLIQAGAKLIKNAHDILIEYTSEPIMQTTLFEECAASDNKESFSLDRHIVQMCKKGACTIDEIIEQTNLSLAEIQLILFELQLDGKIVQTGTGLWLAE